MIKFTNLNQKETLITSVLNLIGYKTNRKIIVFESDDWGMTRMPSKEVYNHLLDKGYPVNICPYNKFDSLESNQDLEGLINVLNSVKDINNNPAKFTLNNVVANPDFEKIRLKNFKEYYYEPFTKTLERYTDTNRVLDLYFEGIRKGVFNMQFHAREHLNINRWLYELQNNNKTLLDAFHQEMYSLPNNLSISGRRNYLDAFGKSYQVEYEDYSSILDSGLRLFKKIWGFESKTFIAPCYTWHPEIENKLKLHGVDGLQGNRVQRVPVCNTNLRIKKKYHYTGQKNKIKQIYTVRNLNFEPFESKDNFDLNKLKKQVDYIFKFKTPLIISSHRANYVGRISVSNREQNLKRLKTFLEFLTVNYDVEFMSSDELVKLIRYGEK